uniref:Uncharacterized protein n=1 Tax=Aegilops tauschii subsp. strangulata TaxID=200361 RepID=A0A452ZVJ9_AEGTS
METSVICNHNLIGTQLQCYQFSFPRNIVQTQTLKYTHVQSDHEVILKK